MFFNAGVRCQPAGTSVLYQRDEKPAAEPAKNLAAPAMRRPVLQSWGAHRRRRAASWRRRSLFKNWPHRFRQG
ncbi:MAG: hypothetical protein B7Z73_00930 [Planctomycetia bacterium 21-64-5]|nr:MAG: hypothetical protein B7Z73_00930 [Planctomycetia bacterium 21-64-5]